jgi:hypothetical protein
MVYDPIIEGQWMASKPTAAQSSIGDVNDRLQDNGTTGEHVISSHGVAASRQLRQQVPSQPSNSSKGSSLDHKEQPPQEQHARVSQNGVDHCNSFCTNRSSSSKHARASSVWGFLGLQATFVVSAAWHLLLYFAVTGTFGWRWMWFFVAQGPLLLLEAKLGKAARAAGISMPRMLRILLTNLLLTVMADPLLITPVVESGVVDGCFAQARMVAGMVMEVLDNFKL